ncbi:unnamed protein product [Polarella glacialis]|uniref:Non-haem dioxygenase N-terminal domain-containing protein n=2 Tax=Polarella glacialis TaxID=89957 RepID=A0A813GXL1_POLGL|nr:unnamed protein product [Polarella glacialis]
MTVAGGGEEGSKLVVLEYADLQAGKDLTAEVARAFGPSGLGICAVRGIPNLQEIRQKLLPQARELALLSPEKLARYELPEAQYCTGWSRGREKFKGKPDLAKGSFYANPLFEDPADGDEAIRAKYPWGTCRNVWPEELPELAQAFKDMARLMYEAAKPLVRQCDLLVEAQHPGHGQKLFEATFTNSRMCSGRLLHYYSPSSVPNAGKSDAWCGWHNDNSVITALAPAIWMLEETGEQLPVACSTGGLYVRSRDRKVTRVSLPADCIGFQIGEASQIMSQPLGGMLLLARLSKLASLRTGKRRRHLAKNVGTAKRRRPYSKIV